jgi:putative copper resistance protein D
MKLNPLWDLAFALAILATGYWYRSEREARASVSRTRQYLFYLALTLSAILLVGPIPHLAVRIFWVHMIQHIGLMMLISPLLVLGSPIKVAQASRHGWLRRALHRLGHNPAFRQLFRAPVGFAIFLAVLIGTHFSPLANAGMTNPNAHCLELTLFVIGGTIYYYPVMEGNPHIYFVPYSNRVISLFAMMLPETMVGFFLYSGNRVLHALPSQTSMSMGLADQHQGGAIMWAMGMLIDTIWIVLAAKDWLAHEKLLAEQEDEIGA